MSIEAMELALEALKFVNQTGDTQTFDMCYADKAITALEEALAQPEQEPKCNPHPKAPHGFNRNASHANDRYTCECEGWDAYDAGYQAGVLAGIEASTGQEPEQEPVAWITPDGEGFRIRFSPPVNDVPLGWDALYTTQPQRKPLTDEEIKQDFEKWAKKTYVQGLEPYGDSYHNGHTRNRWQGWLAAHRAIEAAHGIKE